jgi:3-keto-5-aminohexanoate cleavage enzyme
VPAGARAVALIPVPAVPDPKSLFFMTSMMDATVPWGVIHDGMTDFTLLATAIGLGASLVRVGFEDSIF